MKLKTLKKKIRRLEARLQEGPKKLAKLKRKLEAVTKSAARAREARRTAKSSAPTQKKEGGLTTQPPTKPAGTKRRNAKKAKRKLNLSPERRAQLAAAMKARWAAKRAAEAKPPKTSPDRNLTLGEVPRSP